MPFTVRVSDAQEIEQGDDPAQVALENARRKASAAHREGAAEAVIGCDTIVVLDGAIYGKPADEAAARATMSALGGRTHEVISGLALLLCDGGSPVELRTAVARTRGQLPRARRRAAGLVRRDRRVARALGRLCDPGTDGRGWRWRCAAKWRTSSACRSATLLELYPELSKA